MSIKHIWQNHKLQRTKFMKAALKTTGNYFSCKFILENSLGRTNCMHPLYGLVELAERLVRNSTEVGAIQNNSYYISNPFLLFN